MASKNVEILDPAVGTGTFITDIIEHLKAHPQALRHKYLNEIHCNEVAILPYYIANLNIEFTYAQLAGKYEEFPHICFVDTLDNLGFEQTHTGQQLGLLGSMSGENIDRIAKQNKRKISVILGNPPYNANQVNDNDNNRNRFYEGVDKRIKETWIAASNAQKTKLYDMYARFFRWAADRVNSDGVIAFITNRSFIDSRTFDGFRLEMVEEFDEVHVVDLGGDVRGNPKLSGTTHNVFGIQTGVAVSFWVKKHRDKKSKKSPAFIYYARRPEMETAEDKLSWLSATHFAEVPFEPITPDDDGNWINQADNDFGKLLPLANKDTKSASSAAKERALFKLYSLGASSNRDDWAYDFDMQSLKNKAAAFCETFTNESKRWRKAGQPKDIGKFVSRQIKWTAELESHLKKGTELQFDPRFIRRSLYRPFVTNWTYFAPVYTHRPYQQDRIFPIGSDLENLQISVYSLSSTWPLATIASTLLSDLNQLKQGNGGTFVFPMYRYDTEGQRHINLTDWGVKQFEKRYGKRAAITPERIFAYVYAVLHDPAYREKYALNLKRELPRIPLYDDFARWANWGAQLVALHIGFESAEPFALERAEAAALIGDGGSKLRLRADKISGQIVVDDTTTLSGIPSEAWAYKLGNRSALEWVLDQYKERQPRDPTIREHFNTYRFAAYKERVIELLRRVTTVSTETQRIITQMRQTPG
jgi:predicted helicase